MTQEESSLRRAGRLPASERLPLDFSAFHRMHRPAYVRRAERDLRCRADAEEAVDEAFEKLLHKWTKVLQSENPAAYAWTVLRNTIRDFARKRGRRLSELQDAVFGTVALRTAEDPYGQLEENMRLFSAIQSLAPRQREVIRLRYCEGYSPAETADLLGISEAGVRSTERYAKRHLSEIYSGYMRQEEGHADDH